MIEFPRLRLRTYVVGSGVVLLIVVLGYFAPHQIRIWRTRALLRECLAAVTQYTQSQNIIFGPTPKAAPSYDVGADSLDRESVEIDLTRRLLWAARQTTAGRRLWDQLPTAQRARASFTSFDLWRPHQRYEPGDRVGFANNGQIIAFTCIKRQPDPPDAAAAPPNPTYWIQLDVPADVPEILDLWGNPVVYEPKGAIWIRTGGKAEHILRSPDHQPFFVSGGPDGDLRTGSDNVYSFKTPPREETP